MYTLFTYIVLSNLMGMMLYSLTLTSHAVITFYIGFSLFIGIVYTAIREQGDKFVETFIPSGAPSFLLPPLIVIEVISYFSRPLSLSIRLFANMLSGHALLYILSGFFFSIAKKNLLAAIFPAVLIVLIVGLEVMIAVLQAYVFVVLICIYLNDSLSGAH
ncbi:UNVERIFIED_CONTAM: hypothetical protein GTU68_065748 [Idotea baltica]|nr:hypothetical protein [Idotea baltica]